jgi:phage baseplate assembly protein W
MEPLQYNTSRVLLKIPEYGRHIHKMIDQAIEVRDKDERNKIAKAIIGVMGNLNPHLRDVADFQHKLWDQLFIMSRFKLDVDCPFEKPNKDLLEARPGPLSYPQSYPKYRFYGNNLKNMIDAAIKWEDGELKDALVFNIANHMKKSFLNWNKDTVDDKVIFDHLKELSNGKLEVNPELLPLTETSSLLKFKTKNGNGPRSNLNYRKSNRNRKRY